MSSYNFTTNSLYLAIPRTASTSISQIMGQSGHHDIKYYREFFKYMATGMDINDVYKFAFVRNPYDRFVSAFSHLKLHPDKFTKFVKDYRNWWYTDDPVKQLLFKPQWRYICTWDMKLQVDFVGRYESIEDDWSKVAKRLGVSDKLEHTNKSERGKWQEYYTPELRGIIENKYREDFHLFYPDEE